MVRGRYLINDLKIDMKKNIFVKYKKLNIDTKDKIEKRKTFSLNYIIKSNY